MSYAVRNDGKGWRAVNSVSDVTDDETFSETPPDAITPSASDLVKAQISAIEATITQRRLREAALTEDGKAWLLACDKEIAALRATLSE